MDRKWRALIIVCVAIFMLLLDITVVNVALPDIQKRTGRQDDCLRGLLMRGSDRKIGNSESLDVDLRAVGQCPQFQWRNTMFM